MSLPVLINTMASFLAVLTDVLKASGYGISHLAEAYQQQYFHN